jgi:hypothetical protein
MSQSDYIRFKKTALILKADKLMPVLDPSQYTSFETYNLETTVTNTKNAFSRLVPSTNQYFFDIEKKTSSCATFPLCVNTNTRANRVLNTAENIVLANGTKVLYRADPTYSNAPNKLYRQLKNYTPIRCAFKKGFVIRNALCDKQKCKCRTKVLGAHQN